MLYSLNKIKWKRMWKEFPNEKNLADFIIDFEAGSLEWLDCLNLFAYLIKTKQAWSLQGSYGRHAMTLIEEGYISKEGDILKSHY